MELLACYEAIQNAQNIDLAWIPSCTKNDVKFVHINEEIDYYALNLR